MIDWMAFCPPSILRCFKRCRSQPSSAWWRRWRKRAKATTWHANCRCFELAPESKFVYACFWPGWCAEWVQELYWFEQNVHTPAFGCSSYRHLVTSRRERERSQVSVYSVFSKVLLRRPIDCFAVLFRVFSAIPLFALSDLSAPPSSVKANPSFYRPRRWFIDGFSQKGA